jgi:hypothetical protein
MAIVRDDLVKQQTKGYLMVKMPKVGDRMFDKAIGNDTRRSQGLQITEVEVVKVGRKYFTCQSIDRVGKPIYKYTDIEYYIERGAYKQNTEYCQNHALYQSRQDIIDESEAISIRDYLRGFFGNYGIPTLSLGALRNIKAVIEGDQPPAGSP